VHRLFAPVIAPLVEAAEPETIVEVGAGAGRLTRRLLEAPGAAEAAVHAIDPAPRLDPTLCEAEAERLRVHAAPSRAALGSIGAVDLALLDGDPNWHTVQSDMKALARAARRAERDAPLIVVHHVHWPFGRRDGYYEPEAIPRASRHEHTDLGLVPGRREPSEQGLRLVPWSAVREFAPRSGVLTAVEDFVAASELDWTVVEVPGFHGVAVLAEARRLERQPALAAVLEDLRSPRFLGRQARHTESARLAAELNLAAEPEQPLEPSVASSQPAPLPEPVAEAPRREAMEWRLERVEEELADSKGRLDALAAERDSERQAATEARVRLEQAAQGLRTERAEASRLGARVKDLEQQLREAVERARLAEGRLAHSQDLAAALREERDAHQAEAERLRGESRAALEEVAEHLEHARGGRLARALHRLRPGRRRAPVEHARSAAERGLLPAPAGEAEQQGEAAVFGNDAVR
jgi:hypothetical protein